MKRLDKFIIFFLLLHFSRTNEETFIFYPKKLTRTRTYWYVIYIFNIVHRERASSWFNAEQSLPGWHSCHEGLRGVALFHQHFACTFWNGKEDRRHEQVRLDLGRFWPLWQEASQTDFSILLLKLQFLLQLRRDFASPIYFGTANGWDNLKSTIFERNLTDFVDSETPLKELT